MRKVGMTDMWVRCMDDSGTEQIGNDVSSAHPFFASVVYDNGFVSAARPLNIWSKEVTIVILLALFGYVSIKISSMRLPLINYMFGDHAPVEGGELIGAASSFMNKQWAVMMIGGARTYAFTCNLFLRNAISQTDPPMYVFVSTQSTNLCSVDWLSAVLLEADSRAWRYHDELPSIDVHVQTRDRFQREQVELLQLIDDYTKQTRITYNYIFYARPNLHYTRPMSIAKLEKTFEENGNGSIFTPVCCAYGGWFDQLAVAHYKDFASMIKASDQWVVRGVNGYYEKAFMDRGQFTNLTSFDMHITPNLTEDYGLFVTARLGAALEQCNERTEEWLFWCDTECNNFGGFNLNLTHAMCKYLNQSLAKKEGCRYYNVTP